jgi:hypothetical protein
MINGSPAQHHKQYGSSQTPGINVTFVGFYQKSATGTSSVAKKRL